MKLDKTKNLILDNKKYIEAAAKENKSCEDFILDFLDKSLSELEIEEFELWNFAFINAENWSVVEDKFSIKSNLQIQSNHVLTNNSAFKEIKNAHFDKNKMNPNTFTYEILDDAYLSIEFFTQDVYGLNFLFLNFIKLNKT